MLSDDFYRDADGAHDAPPGPDDRATIDTAPAVTGSAGWGRFRQPVLGVLAVVGVFAGWGALRVGPPPQDAGGGMAVQIDRTLAEAGKWWKRHGTFAGFAAARNDLSVVGGSVTVVIVGHDPVEGCVMGGIVDLGMPVVKSDPSGAACSADQLAALRHALDVS